MGTGCTLRAGGLVAWAACHFLHSAAAFIPPSSVNTKWAHKEASTARTGVRGRTPALSLDMSSDGGSSFSRRALLENAASTTFAASVIATLGGTGGAAPAQAKPQRVKGGGPIITLDDGAQYQEMTIGDGPTPRDGDRVAVHYSLYYGGLEVESSRDSQGLAARPLGFTFGTVSGPGSVPPGLNECITGMKVGGRRKITLPPELAFGKDGRPPFIPGGATVLFDVSLWSVKPAGMDPNLTMPGSSLF